MTDNEKKKQIQNTFDNVCEKYDDNSLRFFINSAKHLVSILPLNGTEYILDAGTGTGNAAIEFAKKFPNAKIVGIDFSNGMLSRAKEKVLKENLKNISFVNMDMQDMTFQNEIFDVINCSFGIFFIEDMIGLINKMKEKLKKQGLLVVTTFHEGTFLPLSKLFYNRIQEYGFNVTGSSWKKIGTEKGLKELLISAELSDINIVREKVGYYLYDVNEWWQIICGTAMKRLVDQIPLDKIDKFQKEHLEEIKKHMTEKGIWLEVEIMHALCKK
jgi:ubiquinone/menaquinone biosynthesis C-methylase UbiE